MVRFRYSPAFRVGAVLSAALLFAGCALGGHGTPAAPSSTFFDPIPLVAAPTVPSWFNVEMTDVNTGKSFKMSDFSGKVVLVDTMATWCPTCQGEMSEVKRLPDLVGPNAGDLVRVSLDVDPNEDAAILKKYADANAFDWYVAIAPIEVGRCCSSTRRVVFTGSHSASSRPRA